MFRKFFSGLLRLFGLKLIRIPKESLNNHGIVKTGEVSQWNWFRVQLASTPLDAGLHLQFAEYAHREKRPFLAYAELKSSKSLGMDPESIGDRLSRYRQCLPDLLDMDHNQYFRFHTLSSEIMTRAKKDGFSVLDVGGGEGRLSAFLPETTGYCLAEPSMNGISGTTLPFHENSYDYVVACHVLEHVSDSKRCIFLDQLLAVSRYGLILLNPFQVQGTFVRERLELMSGITGAPWVKEHLQCDLPEVMDIKLYAQSRGIRYSIRPDGDLMTSMAFVYLDYFAHKSGQLTDLHKINRFYNEKYIDLLHSEKHPNAYLVFMEKPATS